MLLVENFINLIYLNFFDFRNSFIKQWEKPIHIIDSSRNMRNATIDIGRS